MKGRRVVNGQVTARIAALLAGLLVLTVACSTVPGARSSGPRPGANAEPSGAASVAAASQRTPAQAGGTAGLLTPAGARSGLPWNSGIFAVDRVAGAASYQQAQSTADRGRGRASDVEQAAQWNDDWTALTGMEVLTFMNPDLTAAVGLPPFPPSGSWQEAASGAYDSYYRQIGRRIAQLRPSTPTILRLAWEFNLRDPAWKADRYFVAGWRQAVTNIRAGAGSHASSIYFSWCVSRLDPGAGYDPRLLWPGDAYVNFVEVDVYDIPPSTAGRFPGGQVLDTLARFAVTHGKKIAIEEWGLHHTSSGKGGGDNPRFVDDMFGWIRSHTSMLVYESYFQDDAPDNVNSALFSPTKNANPASRAAYLKQIRAG